MNKHSEKCGVLAFRIEISSILNSVCVLWSQFVLILEWYHMCYVLQAGTTLLTSVPAAGHGFINQMAQVSHASATQLNVANGTSSPPTGIINH